jgi:Flp pilus assembly secretin CpaC
MIYMRSNSIAKVVSLLLLFCFYSIMACRAQVTHELAPKSKQRARIARSLGLQEYKVSKEIDLDVSQARLFKIGAFIARTSVADPSIACPVVLCEDQFIIIGSKQGTTSITIWDNSGQVIAMTVNVKENTGKWSNQISRGVAFDNKSAPTSEKFTLSIREVELSEEASKTVAKCLAFASKRNAQLLTKKPQNKPANQLMVSGYTLLVGEGTNASVRVSIGSKAEHAAAVQTQPKFTQTINVPVGQSRTIRTKNKIARCTVISPSIVEPIVVSTTETVLIGKTPGNATLIIQDTSESIESIKINCLQGNAILNVPTENAQTTSIPSVPAKPMHVIEKRVEDHLSLSIAENRCFNTNNDLARVAIADEKIAEVVFTHSNQIVLSGIYLGETTLFLWDDKGNSKGVEVIVGETSSSQPTSRQVSKTSKPESRQAATEKLTGFTEIEYWTGTRKDVLSVSRRAKL